MGPMAPQGISGVPQVGLLQLQGVILRRVNPWLLAAPPKDLMISRQTQKALIFQAGLELGRVRTSCGGFIR